MIQTYKDLKVYGLSYSLAMDIFRLTKTFPREERFALTDQIRRASRSISANIVERWAKRRYENVFKRHLLDSIASCDETKLWLCFAFECQYITKDERDSLEYRCEEIGKMLHALSGKWSTSKRRATS